MHARLRPIIRRQFLHLATAAAATASFPLGGRSLAADSAQPRMKKALKFGMVKLDGSVMDKFKLLKELGFDGVELDAPSSLDRNEILAARDATGLEIPGVVDAAHWRDALSSPDSGRAC